VPKSSNKSGCITSPGPVQGEEMEEENPSGYTANPSKWLLLKPWQEGK